MLNKEAQDLPQAKFSVEVTTVRSELYNVINESKFSYHQYYNNNTVYDLSIMDTLGVRQTLKRKTKRTGTEQLQIVREYKISSDYEHETRDFFDEVTDKDGIVLSTIKSVVNERNFFTTGGFGSHYHDNKRMGYQILVIFNISQEQLANNVSLDCQELGFTISRMKRERMPANPLYAACLNGSYNPFRNILGHSYKVSRVFANSHTPIKDRYWYFVGDILTQVEYNQNRSQPEGIYVTTFMKDLDSDETINEQVKYLIFNEALNKNGFFISERDAMLASNVELASREKEVSLKERELLIKTKDVELTERLNISKHSLEHAKQQHYMAKHSFEVQSNNNAQALEGHKHNNAIIQLQIESENLYSKRAHQSIESSRDTQLFRQKIYLEDKQFINESIKLKGVFVKHNLAMSEMARSEIVSEATTLNKLQSIEASMIAEQLNMHRKADEDRIKNMNTIFNGIMSTVKIIGK